MSTRPILPGPLRHQHGFSLVELMVTVAIALFLLLGLVTIVENMRGTYLTQQSLVQLQDQQRFALTVMTDAIQAAGYFPDPTGPALAASPPFGAGWVFVGSHSGASDNVALDTISTRFQTDPLSYGPVSCNGIDTTKAAAATWVVQFSVVANQLVCTVNNVTTPLVDHVTALAIYYGVKHDNTVADFNVDTYENWDVLNASGDWLSVSSVRIVITFANPLAGQPSQPATLTVERVVQVMARGGLHT